MSYRITYGRRKRRGWRLLWAIPLLGMLAAVAANFEALARYVGAAIRGH